jgi:hypothetical protein
LQAGNLTVQQAVGKVRGPWSLVRYAAAVTGRRGSAATVHAVTADVLTGRDVR